ncbi:MAG: hypothetical protein C0501_12790 [Isosphaera sp.]|nr:hypothetical protein [Isosphaera sp.]
MAVVIVWVVGWWVVLRTGWGRHSCLPGRQECLPHRFVRWPQMGYGCGGGVQEGSRPAPAWCASWRAARGRHARRVRPGYVCRGRPVGAAGRSGTGRRRGPRARSTGPGRGGGSTATEAAGPHPPDLFPRSCLAASGWVPPAARRPY